MTFETDSKNTGMWVVLFVPVGFMFCLLLIGLGMAFCDRFLWSKRRQPATKWELFWVQQTPLAKVIYSGIVTAILYKGRLADSIFSVLYYPLRDSIPVPWGRLLLDFSIGFAIIGLILWVPIIGLINLWKIFESGVMVQGQETDKAYKAMLIKQETDPTDEELEQARKRREDLLTGRFRDR